MITRMQALYPSQEPPERPVEVLLRLEDLGRSMLGDKRIQMFLIVSAKASEMKVRPRQGRLLAGEAFREAAERKRAALAEAERTEQELRWLRENRDLYAGRWVALVGNRVVAEGESAREVYAAVAGQEEIPLVVRVEPLDGHPFAGW